MTRFTRHLTGPLLARRHQHSINVNSRWDICMGISTSRCYNTSIAEVLACPNHSIWLPFANSVIKLLYLLLRQTSNTVAAHLDNLCQTTCMQACSPPRPFGGVHCSWTASLVWLATYCSSHRWYCYCYQHTSIGLSVLLLVLLSPSWWHLVCSVLQPWRWLLLVFTIHGQN